VIALWWGKSDWPQLIGFLKADLHYIDHIDNHDKASIVRVLLLLKGCIHDKNKAIASQQVIINTLQEDRESLRKDCRWLLDTTRHLHKQLDEKRSKRWFKFW
jgi:hypothetical protein